jgi:hypothetical protein
MLPHTVLRSGTGAPYVHARDEKSCERQNLLSMLGKGGFDCARNFFRLCRLDESQPDKL